MSVTRKLKSINNTYATVQRSLRNSYFYLARIYSITKDSHFK